MKQKIEWYREVLEIEPNSKIFFPLARMLFKDGQANEAITVLQAGVGRHPDHIEARLLLAELLYGEGRSADLQREVGALSDLFKQYPGFWKAWGEKLFADDATRDAGLAAVFLSAFLQNLPVSWAGVIEQGLKGLLNGEAQAFSATMHESHPLKSSESSPEAIAELAEQVRHTTSPAIEEPSVEAASVSDEDEPEEPISLRTRSMAEVLAEQGDVGGALEIYQELLASSSSDQEKAELRARMDDLSSTAAAPAVESAAGGDDVDRRHEGKNRLTDMLEALAQRLEARSLH